MDSGEREEIVNGDKPRGVFNLTFLSPLSPASAAIIVPTFARGPLFLSFPAGRISISTRIILNCFYALGIHDATAGASTARASGGSVLEPSKAVSFS